MDKSKFAEPHIQAVQWGEMDALGHVNNVMYFRYFESARVSMMYNAKLWQMLDEAGLYVILAKIDCNFRQPLYFPDEISIYCRIKSVGKTSMVVEHIVESPKLGIVAYGDGVVVCVSKETHKSQPLPDEVKEKLGWMLD